MTVIAFLLSLSISDPQPAEALDNNLLLLLVSVCLMAYFYFGKPRLQLDRSGSRLPGLSATRPTVTGMNTVCDLWVNSSFLFRGGDTWELHNNLNHPFEFPKQGAPDEGFALFHAKFSLCLFSFSENKSLIKTAAHLFALTFIVHH